MGRKQEIKSALVDDMDVCIVCGRPRENVHHVIHGTANRKISDRYGYVIPLCVEHHTGGSGIHNNRDMNVYWKRQAQKHFEAHHGTRQDFIKEFGKSWL
jgi:hypothetical protein